MVRTLMPWFNNSAKRLVKSPELFLRDSGLFHTLQDIETRNQLLSNPKLGASWEGFAVEQISRHLALRDNQLFFWATHAGAELDLCWKQGGKRYGIECKFTDAPKLTRSMKTAIEDLELDYLWVI